MEGSVKFLRTVFEEYYNRACNSSGGNPVCWASTFAPAEVIKAFDVDIFYPESYAAAISSRRQAKDFFFEANSCGFSQDICSYARLFQGAMKKEYFPYGKLRRPNFLIGTNNQCGTIQGWWRVISEELGVPVFILDMPGGRDEEVLGYVRTQIDDMVSFLEKTTGRTLDENKLKQITDISRKTSDAWKACISMRKYNLAVSRTPRFMDFLFPIVVARGTEPALYFYQAFLEELQAEKAASEDDGLFRILWLGYPFWFSSCRVFPERMDGAAIVMDNYTGWWSFDIEAANPLESMAAVYNHTYLNRSLEERAEETLKLVRDFSINGVIIHVNKSCKRDAIFQKAIRGILSSNGIPAILIEADMCDKDAFSERRIEEAADLLIENIRMRNDK